MACTHLDFCITKQVLVCNMDATKHFTNSCNISTSQWQYNSDFCARIPPIKITKQWLKIAFFAYMLCKNAIFWQQNQIQISALIFPLQAPWACFIIIHANVKFRCNTLDFCDCHSQFIIVVAWPMQTPLALWWIFFQKNDEVLRNNILSQDLRILHKIHKRIE